jgi:peptidoglycan/xylan/chitin deacetylase (PgdA/CDA1 family)
MIGRSDRKTLFYYLLRLSFLLNLISMGCVFPALSPVSSKAETVQNLSLSYLLDRSALPWLTYNDVTLKIFIGPAQSVSASADGKTIPVLYNSQSGYALVTTSGLHLKIDVIAGTNSANLGSFTKTALKGDHLWAWSHGFDDNVNFKTYGIPAFEKLGYRATVYLIGHEIDATRNESWIIDKPDIMALVNKGWGIGNHSWSHDTVAGLGGSGAAKKDVVRLATYLRQVVDEAGRKDYRLMSFAAPNFDADYQGLINDLRDTKTTEILFNESGNDSLLRVDVGATDINYPIFTPKGSLGRDWRIETYGSNDPDDVNFRKDVAAIIAKADGEHHFWLNTLSHAVDQNYDPKLNVFGFLTWVDKHYGTNGNKSVWIAPSDEIYSYMLVRDGIKIIYNGQSSYSPKYLYLPAIQAGSVLTGFSTR